MVSPAFIVLVIVTDTRGHARGNLTPTSVFVCLCLRDVVVECAGIEQVKVVVQVY